MTRRATFQVMGVVAGWILICALFGPAMPQVEAQTARLSQTEMIDVSADRFADAGQYFCAMTQTPGTAYNLTGATQNAFLATQALWVVANTAQAADKRRIYLDLAKIVFATGGTAGTSFQLSAALDNGNRYSSGGTAQTVFSTNMALSVAQTPSIASVRGGDITTTAATGAVRYVSRSTVSSTIPAAGETYVIDFGSIAHNTHISKMTTVPPLVIGAGQSVVVHAWLPSQTATPTGELLICWRER
jgi:hypothetical protein